MMMREKGEGWDKSVFHLVRLGECNVESNETEDGIGDGWGRWQKGRIGMIEVDRD